MSDLEYMKEAKNARMDSTCRKKQLGCVLKFTDITKTDQWMFHAWDVVIFEPEWI
jgi:hypothetical protein